MRKEIQNVILPVTNSLTKNIKLYIYSWILFTIYYIFNNIIKYGKYL